MALERQAVQGIQQVQRAVAPAMAGTQALRVGDPAVIPQGNSLFIDDLLSVAGGAAKIATDVMNAAVEEDKIRQYGRAMEGLMPSQDATRGGARAHMLARSQNKIDEMTLRLQDEAQRFQGTDAEWEEHVINARRAIQWDVSTRYPELSADKETGKLLTTAFMEQQPKVFAARAGAKLKQEQQERQDTLRSRILSNINGLSAEQATMALHALQQEAITMQVTKPEFEEMVSQIAMEQAAIGDGTLIDATKGILDAQGVSLYKRNGKLMSAAISADRMHSSLNQVELFEKKDGITSALFAGEATWEEALQVFQNHNDVSGGVAWSDSEIKALKAKLDKAAADEAATNALRMAGQGESPMGLRDFTAKQRKDYAEILHEDSTKMANAEIQRTGATGEQAEAIRGKYEQARLMNMARNVLQDPVAKERFDSLMMMSPENLKDMTTEPEAMQTLMRTRDSLSEAHRRSVLGDKEYAFTENYDRATRMGMNPGQAIAFAQNASKGDKIPSGVMKELNKVTEDVVNDIAGGSWLSRGDNMSDLGKDLMMQEASQIAAAMKVAGHNDDTIERHLKSYLEGQYTQTAEGFFTSGALVKGVQSTAELGRVIGANADDTATVLAQYLTNNEQALLDQAGSGYERGDLYFDIDQKKGTFIIRAGSGRMPLTMPQPLDKIDGQALLDQKYKEEVEKRDKMMEEMGKSTYGDEMKSNYQNMKGSFKEGQDVTAKAVGKKGIADFLMSPAFASGQNLPGNFEFGYQKNNSDFYNYVAKQENPANEGLNRVSGTFEPYKDAHGQSIGYGHFITATERKNGYIEIDGQKVPFTPGRSQLTPDMARKLLEQDVKSHVPNTSDWNTPFDKLHPSVQRGIMDLTYNLGKGGIANAPKAEAAFKAGKITQGFIHMLGTSSTEGKRSTGLLVRRAEAYNMAMKSSGLPLIKQVETNADGSMRVKFDGEMSQAFVGAEIGSKISSDGWLTVYGSKKDILHKYSKVGTINIK